MSDQPNDQMVLLSQYYPGLYTQLVPEQGTEVKTRRKRKKSKGEGSNSGFRKRKLTDEQAKMLELNFGNEHKLESVRKDKLALELGLDPRQVAVWFQNRRARWKNKKLEEEYSKLKNEHESTIVEKCQLETEVLKLKEKLSEADNEIEKLLQRSDGGSTNSASSSFSGEFMEVVPFLGEFGNQGLENMFYSPEYVCGTNGLDYWASLYDM